MNIKSILIISCFVFSSLFQNVKSQPGWFQLNSGTASNLVSVVSLDTNIVLIAGENFILRSTDGGLTFNTINIPSLTNSKKFETVDENIVYLLANVSIFRSINKGANWQMVTDYLMDDIYDLDFINLNTGIVGGVDNWPRNSLSPVPLYGITTNGGANWTINHFNDLGNTTFVKMFDEENIYAIIHNRIHKTSNSGTNWTSFFMNLNNPYKYFFNSFSLAYTSGYVGAILKTTNGGTNWISQESGTNLMLNNLFFINDTTGWIAGNSGTIIHTNNGGTNWISQISTVSNHLNSIHFVDSKTGFAVGNFGTIVKTVSGGVTNISPISNVIPDEYILHQNFPNPFNPSTKIKFDLIQSTNVTLTIYDITGKLIITLVNENLDAGSYEYSWDASGFSSGLYFYRIFAGENFHDTKSMILLK
jgi:photosystem II stability/assembly factor-like uncharacterized protein